MEMEERHTAACILGDEESNEPHNFTIGASETYDHYVIFRSGTK